MESAIGMTPRFGGGAQRRPLQPLVEPARRHIHATPSQGDIHQWLPRGILV
jgi:hypothetical protein